MAREVKAVHQIFLDGTPVFVEVHAHKDLIDWCAYQKAQGRVVSTGVKITPDLEMTEINVLGSPRFQESYEAYLNVMREKK